MIDHNSRIVYHRPEDGGLSIVSPAPLEDLRRIPKFEEMTQAEYEAHIIERSLPKGVDWLIFTTVDFPQDRTFRNAWFSHKTLGIQVDMVKARQIHLDTMRVARQPLLDNLDVEFMRAVESQDKTAQTRIASQKQTLRDVTTTDLSAASTPEQLKAIWPEALNG
jgi:hypothetical protein